MTQHGPAVCVQYRHNQLDNARLQTVLIENIRKLNKNDPHMNLQMHPAIQYLERSHGVFIRLTLRMQIVKSI